MVAKTFSATCDGILGNLVQVEAARQNMVPRIQITGLAGDIVRESAERIGACLEGLGFHVPTGRVLVHLSPAHRRKQGSQFDLAIALSVLGAETLVSSPLFSRTAFLGELRLDGQILPVRGALALLEVLEDSPQVDTIVLPYDNQTEAALIKSKKARLVNTLVDALEFLEGRRTLEIPKISKTAPVSEVAKERFLIDQMKGQALAKRALQIALAGRHHLLLLGPPGVGKTMLAQAASQLLPPLSGREIVEVAKIYGVSHRRSGPVEARPFRTPHHSVSAAGLLGGGTGQVIPGEVSLSHLGVLFLDELPEFRRDVLDGLREPMESGEIHLQRVGGGQVLPARFLLVAAMNPCPCGLSLSPSRRCGCPVPRVLAYRRKVSGAVLDRIGLGVVMLPPETAQAAKPATVCDFGKSLKESVQRAHEVQRERYGPLRQNGDACASEHSDHFALGSDEQRWFSKLMDGKALSYRGLSRVTRVARTIADLAGEKRIGVVHLQEAWSLRCPQLHDLRI